MDPLTSVLATVVNTLVIALVVRRLLGVPVGWPRTIVLSLVVGTAFGGLWSWIGGVTGIVSSVTSSTPAGEVVTAVLVLALATAWLLAVEAAVLAVLEVIVPTGSLPGPVTWLRSLPARNRRARRYAAILRLASKHGLGAYLRPRGAVTEESPSRVARSLRLALTDGGVCFVKLGQMISTRPDLVPPAFVAELSSLQSHVPAEPWADVRPVIEEGLGRPLTEVFASIDETPLAAASVAQVHAATLLTGEDVVVKVQRPGARRQVLADLDIITRLARWLDRTTAWGRGLGVADLADGFATSMHEELDYTVELANMQAVAATTEDGGPVPVRVPTAYDALCSERVMVVERLTGRPVNTAPEQLAAIAPEQRRAMAEALFSAVLQQVVAHGVFHADLHPGNIFLDPDGGFTLLDFGAVGRLDAGTRHSLGALLMAVDRQDSVTATDALIDLLDRPADLDDRRLERDVGQLLVRFGGGGGSAAGGTAAMFTALFSILLAHRFRVPPQVAAAFRALGALEGTLALVSPGLDVLETARSQGQALMAERLEPAAVRAQLEGQLAALLPMLQRLPRRVDRVSQQLEEGRFTVRISLFGSADERSFVTGLVQQVVVAGLAAALALCGIVLMIADTGPMMTPTLRTYTFLGFALLLFGFVLGARALVLTFRQHHLSSAPRRYSARSGGPDGIRLRHD